MPSPYQLPDRWFEDCKDMELPDAFNHSPFPEIKLARAAERARVREWAERKLWALGESRAESYDLGQEDVLKKLLDFLKESE